MKVLQGSCTRGASVYSLATFTLAWHSCQAPRHSFELTPGSLSLLPMHHSLVFYSRTVFNVACCTIANNTNRQVMLVLSPLGTRQYDNHLFSERFWGFLSRVYKAIRCNDYRQGRRRSKVLYAMPNLTLIGPYLGISDPKTLKIPNFANSFVM